MTEDGRRGMWSEVMGREMIGRVIGLLGICVGLVVSSPVAGAKDWQVRVADDATVEILCQGVPIVKSAYVFWGQNWGWADAQMKLGAGQADGWTFAGSVSNLSLGMEGTIRSGKPNQLNFLWKMNVGRELKNIVGGGLEFRLALDSPALEKRAADPFLLPNNRGWSWRVGENEDILVVFDKPIHNIYFERGKRDQIRAMFLGGEAAWGRQVVGMTVTVPEGGRIARPLAERYGPADVTGWYVDVLPHDTSPVDLSFLNHKPAGKFGFVKASGDKLVFENGQEARFWGGNIAAYAIFVDKQQIETQAKRIAQLGYNLMRIHHHDSMRWVSRTVIDKTRSDSQQLDEEVMDRLDYWIKCLRDQGVYVWLDLHVGRVFKDGDNIGEGFAEMVRHGEGGSAADAKGYCYFNTRLEQLMREFNEKYLNHPNKYTNLAYKDDPAVMGLLITNENDLTNHFGNLMLADKNNPFHNKIFEADVKKFADKHGLAISDTLRTWLPGPSKLFLADCEYRWNRRMLDALGAIGVKVPVATTQMWGDMSLCGLPSVAASGIIDVHSYGQAEALNVNPRFEDNYVSYMACGQAYGRPVSITEWNVPWPNADRFTAPLYVASIAALQGWDSPMVYNYSQQGFEKPRRPSTWSTFPDLAITGIMPAAAIMFRQGHAHQAKESYCIMLDREKLYMTGSHPRNMTALRTLIERSKVTIGLPDTNELDWDRQTKVGSETQVVTDLNRDFIEPGRDFVRSDTGELTRNWVNGYQIIDTDKTQAVHGWIGGEKLLLKNTCFDVNTPKAVVAVTSLDDKAIGESRRVLVTAIGRVVASADGAMPMLSEPVKARIEIAGPEGLRFFALGGDGAKLGEIQLEYTSGRYVVVLPAARGTHWFVLSEGD